MISVLKPDASTNPLPQFDVVAAGIADFRARGIRGNELDMVDALEHAPILSTRLPVEPRAGKNRIVDNHEDGECG